MSEHGRGYSVPPDTSAAGPRAPAIGSTERFPLTYAECRARFLRAARSAGAVVERHPIDARGRDDERLTIDVARVGAAHATRALLVLSGIHGIEGYAGSAIQVQDLRRGAGSALPAGCALIHVHAVNPWGMAWWRRQNESNVDLNRNWIDFGKPPPENVGYRELHPWLCPDSIDHPTEQAFLAAAQARIAARGFAWVKEAVTLGQYEFADGLYFGGQRREASTLVLEQLAKVHLERCEEVFVIDLHTGHGAPGACTLLSGEPPGSTGDAFVTRLFADETIERTVGDPAATTPHKRGQLSMGICRALEAARAAAVTLEVGTVDDIAMILAERREHWLHRKGDRTTALASEIEWAHRVASIPDDCAWEMAALSHGERILGRARSGLFGLAA